MGKPARVDGHALGGSVLASRWGQDHRRRKGWRRLGGIHIPGGTSRNIPRASTVPEDAGGGTHPPFLQHTGDAAPSPWCETEQGVEGRRALNSQFPSLKADKFKTANVPRKMRPWEIYSSPRLAAPIRCACQPGSLLKNRDKAAAGPQCPNGWQRGRGGRTQVAVCGFFLPVVRCLSVWEQRALWPPGGRSGCSLVLAEPCAGRWQQSPVLGVAQGHTSHPLPAPGVSPWLCPGHCPGSVCVPAPLGRCPARPGSAAGGEKPPLISPPLCKHTSAPGAAV